MTLPAYKLPPAPTQQMRVYCVPIFLDAVPPASACEVSNIIPFPFRITKIVYGCLEATNTEADYYFFVSSNANTPVNAPPPDENILSVLAPQAFVVCPQGSAVQQHSGNAPTLELSYEVPESNKRLKVFIAWRFGVGRRHQVIFTIERTG